MFDFSLGDSMRLRLPEPSDAEEIHALVTANLSHLASWMPWVQDGYTLEGARTFVTDSARQLAANDGFQALIIDDGRIIGTAGFHRVDWLNRSTSIGYWLAADAQGRGTMTRTVAALIDWAFGGWNLNRVEINAAVDNSRSRAIPERLGFSEEGRLRQAERVGDRYLDLVVYSVLAAEWGTTTALPSN